MSDTPAHPMESAIVDALTQGLEALPVSLPPESEVLAAASDPGAPVPSAAAMAGVAEFVGGPETGARRGFSALLSNRWAYVGAAVVVMAATIGIGAGLQFHQGGAQGSASNNRPAAPAPSGGGSQPVGGVPSSTPLATATPPSVTPPPTAVAT
ncbi:MAG: hypothetical protein J2P44_07160, partial [Candidatus Dormibacteraeota bacterium]|nr:hypothetical protein [Candidatus Dormibacteraeota bacterium]